MPTKYTLLFLLQLYGYIAPYTIHDARAYTQFACIYRYGKIGQAERLANSTQGSPLLKRTSSSSSSLLPQSVVLVAIVEHKEKMLRCRSAVTSPFFFCFNRRAKYSMLTHRMVLSFIAYITPIHSYS